MRMPLCLLCKSARYLKSPPALLCHCQAQDDSDSSATDVARRNSDHLLLTTGSVEHYEVRDVNRPDESLNDMTCPVQDLGEIVS